MGRRDQQQALFPTHFTKTPPSERQQNVMSTPTHRRRKVLDVDKSRPAAKINSCNLTR